MEDHFIKTKVYRKSEVGLITVSWDKIEQITVKLSPIDTKITSSVKLVGWKNTKEQRLKSARWEPIPLLGD